MRGAFAGLLLSATAVAGCGNLLGIGDFHLAGDASPAGDGGGDAPDDGAIDSNADAQLCYGTSLITACFATVPTGTIDLSNTLNTTSDARCATLTNMPTGGTPCVIAAGTITVGVGGGKLLVTGSRPLVLVATSTITVKGTLDASSSRSTGRIGPGANSDQCVPAQPGQPSNAGPGGGGGGGYQGVGGPGGKGGGGAPGGIGGSPRPPDYVRGGCPGAIGGSGASMGGEGGSGGGAVYLIAGTQITLMKEIFASGAGGAGPLARAGGGGGGSGGLIGLEAPTIQLGSIVAANGGGGGGGAGTTPGKDGNDGTTTQFSQPALGGTAGNGGSAGGNGGYGGIPAATAPNASLYGAGGGGGAVGFIWVKGTLTGNGGFSPGPTMAP